MKDTYENELLKASIESDLVNGENSPRGNKREGLNYMFEDNNRKTLFWEQQIDLNILTKKHIIIYGYVTAGDAERRDLNSLVVLNTDDILDEVFVYIDDPNKMRNRNTFVEFEKPIVLKANNNYIFELSGKGKDKWGTELIQLSYLDYEEYDGEIQDVVKDSKKNNDSEEKNQKSKTIEPVSITVKFSDGSESKDIPLE